MFVARPLLPAFNRLDGPHELSNRLQLAVYNGRLHKVQQILTETPGSAAHNIYRMATGDMSLLYLAVAGDHLAIANCLMLVYERDFRALERFHAAHGIRSYEWVRKPVLVALGEQQVAEALRLSANVRQTDAARMRDEKRSGLLVMCKPMGNLDEEPQVEYHARIV